MCNKYENIKAITGLRAFIKFWLEDKKVSLTADERRESDKFEQALVNFLKNGGISFDD